MSFSSGTESTVWVNHHADFRATIPFGGAKMSGVGTELAEFGLEEFTQVKVINSAKMALAAA